ncbi:Phenylpropionate dioxygenase or related ring-hydroxylating dioxygenase [Pseudomonas syringae pv. actinidiae]|uniref:Phenylpropionate dioxygenase or related ring-hydroxylating dioxygenase n=1 Tax=Pseudomonas syringae pv. actinidiae TaxID=103796 RepID=A0AAN4QCC4_PSESF|nr:Phenylpropionate dioxygenase or related ring-hydroxylating dioxygenase [Pseudomonas syringae pv. actinidiae]
MSLGLQRVFDISEDVLYRELRIVVADDQRFMTAAGVADSGHPLIETLHYMPLNGIIMVTTAPATGAKSVLSQSLKSSVSRCRSFSSNWL